MLQDNKAKELKKSTKLSGTAVTYDSDEDSESRKPSFLARQLQKLKFSGKSNQGSDASNEINLPKGITATDTSKQTTKSNETQLPIDQPDFNDFIGQVICNIINYDKTAPPTTFLID